MKRDNVLPRLCYTDSVTKAEDTYMKKLSALLFIALLLLASCKEKTPVVEPEIPDDPSMHVPIVSINDEPLETELTKDVMTVTATDIKGSVRPTRK